MLGRILLALVPGTIPLARNSATSYHPHPLATIMEKFIFGILIIITCCSTHTVNDDNESYRVIKRILEPLERYEFKIYSETVQFPLEHLESINFFNIEDFVKVFMIYNLGFIESQDLESIVNQTVLDDLREQVLKMESHDLIANKLELHDSILTDVIPVVNPGDTKTFFPEFRTYLISWPILSSQKNFTMIYVDNRCGLDCGGGEILLLRKTELNDWKPMGSITTRIH